MKAKSKTFFTKTEPSLLNTTWEHKSLKEAGPAVGTQLPNQFIVKSVSKDMIGTWQVGALTTEQTFWPKADFLTNFKQLPPA